VLVETGRSGAYNLGTGQPRSVRDVIDVVERVVGRRVLWATAARRPGDPAVLCADASKARTELRWTPAHPALESIVQTAWAWHQAHPQGYPR
jgi:UDP-glucose 4-epimerase